MPAKQFTTPPNFIRLTTIPANAENLTGRRFARFRVDEYAGIVDNGPRRRVHHWICQCDCGEWRVISGIKLRGGDQVSCGCFNRETVRTRNLTHGQCRTPLYSRWTDMHTRCYNPKWKQYADYGGRGIEVLEPWKSSFEAFAADMGEPPTPQHQLDRIDNEGPYCKENCRWVTLKANQRNKRSNHTLEYNGESHITIEWEELLSLPKGAIWKRMHRGYSIGQALGFEPKPAGKKRGRKHKIHATLTAT